MDDIMTNIEVWLDILNWKDLPNFGNVHTIDNRKEFYNNYYVNGSIKLLKKRLFLWLTGKFEIQNMLLMGKPGCGKTSFLYYLMYESAKKTDSILNNYVFYHFPANRASYNSYQEAEQEVLKNIIDAFEKLYYACGQNDIFNRINQRGISDKAKVTSLTDVYKKRRTSDFPKILIFLVDDVDYLVDQQVQWVARAVITHFNINLIKKWLVVREPTYRSYSDATRQIVDNHFPRRVDFDKISFFEIVEYRIRNTCGNKSGYKNPFSEELCMYVLERLYDESLRSALSILEPILNNTPLVNIDKSKSEEFIQKMINKYAIVAFIKLGILPNLYSRDFRSGHLPIIIDVLLSNRYTKFPELVFAALDQATRMRADLSRSFDSEKFIKARDDDFKFAVDLLLKEGLAVRKGKYLIQTTKGELLAEFVSRTHYRQVCEELLDPVHKDTLFWEFVSHKLNHQKIVLDLISWDKTM